jgi:hypothetical protein
MKNNEINKEKNIKIGNLPFEEVVEGFLKVGKHDQKESKEKREPNEKK